ncbi:galactosyl transferase GMA12/MNN10 family protein [Ilyonectria sp. MPI-CAGE-AT-0026]|nr:galactosyl transferase GMA12/MNN10 family protein [Ilyonectria sp. MPI-CAGE-AT-0026]
MLLRSRFFVKALCVVSILVLSQISWTYWNGRDISSLPFHRIPPIEENIHCYGPPNCFPANRNFSLFNKQNATDFCREYHAEVPGPRPRLAAVTAQFGKPHRHYQRALGTHALHGLVQQTEVHVLSNKIMDDLWNKPAFLLEILLEEMSKPADQRLDWLFWFDRDTIILDNCRSPLSFLPFPGQKDQKVTHQGQNKTNIVNIYLLATKDWNGLNNGVFLLRVNRWSIDLFTAILAHRHYRPDVQLTFTEQSAMGLLLEEPEFQDNVVWVPQWWFNAYPRGDEDFSLMDDKAKAYHARRGDFLVHFAGVGKRDEHMNPWLDVAETATSGWALGPHQRDVDGEIQDFWEGRRGEQN